jgi:hypothetical protein
MSGAIGRGGLASRLLDKWLNESIVITRGHADLPAQRVRIALPTSGSVRDTGPAEVSRGKVVVIGDETFDVKVGDQFNDSVGTLYTITYIRPARSAGIEAEAEADQ